MIEGLIGVNWDVIVIVGGVLLFMYKMNANIDILVNDCKITNKKCNKKAKRDRKNFMRELRKIRKGR